MTNEKVNAVLVWFQKHFEDAGYSPARADPDAHHLTPNQWRKHILWMAIEAQTFPAEKLEKKMRWLGFIQGNVARGDSFTINELKKQNMPDEEKTDAKPEG